MEQQDNQEKNINNEKVMDLKEKVEKVTKWLNKHGVKTQDQKDILFWKIAALGMFILFFSILTFGITTGKFRDIVSINQSITSFANCPEQPACPACPSFQSSSVVCISNITCPDVSVKVYMNGS